jgi:hypothetical protein
MPRLRDVQEQFVDAVLNGGGDMNAQVRPNCLTALQRLAVYRNNVFAGLSEALRDGFPVVHRLVGGDFFDAMVREFIRRHPPQSGCLLDYGAEFPEFVERFEAARRLLYLPDVARLEWAYHESFHAPDAVPAVPADFAMPAASHYCEVRLRLHPAVRLLASNWPVLRIFGMNQPDYAGDDIVDLAREGSCRVLVARPGTDVAFYPLTLGEFVFLNALGRDAGLTGAFEDAIASDSGFDLTEALMRGFGWDVFSHFNQRELP